MHQDTHLPVFGVQGDVFELILNKKWHPVLRM